MIQMYLISGERFWVIMFVFVYALPLLVLVLTHWVMIYYIRTHTIGVNQQQNIKLVFMGVKLVTVFAVCTGFQHVFFFVMSSFSTVRISMEEASILFVLSNGFVSLQASLNPLLYGNFQRTIRKSRKTIRKISDGVLTKLNVPYFKPSNTLPLREFSIIAQHKSELLLTTAEKDVQNDETKL